MTILYAPDRKKLTNPVRVAAAAIARTLQMDDAQMAKRVATAKSNTFLAPLFFRAIALSHGTTAKQVVRL